MTEIGSTTGYHGRRQRLALARTAAIVGVVVLGCALFPADAAADIFVYTDNNGITHFTNRKPDSRYKLYLKTSKRARRQAKRNFKAVPPSDRSLGRFDRYDTWIQQAATLYQIPVELIRAIIKVESDYDPRAVSVAGASGLMQLMPETGLRMQVRDPFDPRTNIFGGTRYLRVLANTFNGDLELTIAGYNAGEGAVIRYGGIPPYAETQAYVLKVLQFYHRYRTIPDVISASQPARSYWQSSP